MFVFSQKQQYIIIHLTGNKFRSLDHHQAIITQNLKQVICSAHYIHITFNFNAVYTKCNIIMHQF